MCICNTNNTTTIVNVFIDELTIDGYGDLVKCSDCGSVQLVQIGEFNCKLCNSDNLQWYGDTQETNISELENLEFDIEYKTKTIK